MQVIFIAAFKLDLLLVIYVSYEIQNYTNYKVKLPLLFIVSFLIVLF